ncbi:DUF1127 domain-containing protein [Roseovarius sp. Pro17]|uniref:DUF1127 domain-containing protein n=1 Tax=Roseovarius sp. Pro17 TaxID=3108175 RepID=UPI002D78E8E6|nr:DUF1127 domain-containing protein [Roseovarius sp. Pro17]
MSIYLTKQMIDPAMSRSQSNDDTGLFPRWILAITQQWRRRKMITALQELDDRMLADIGLHRSDIPRVATALSAREHRMATTAQAPRAENVNYNAYLEAA